MANKAVSNTGPILHLYEINLLKVLDLFLHILIPYEVENELRKNKIIFPSKVKVAALKNEFKDKAKIFVNQHDLDFGEAEAITLALQERADYFLTDDLDARQVAKDYHLNVHGTIGIILRSYRESIISKELAIEKVRELKTKSSLFITQDLIDEVIKTIQDFSRENK